MYNGMDIYVVSFKPDVEQVMRVAAQLADLLRDTINELIRPTVHAVQQLIDEIAESIPTQEDPDPIPPTLKRPGRGIRSVSNLTLRRLDLMPWYTSGFQ